MLRLWAGLPAWTSDEHPNQPPARPHLPRRHELQVPVIKSPPKALELRKPSARIEPPPRAFRLAQRARNRGLGCSANGSRTRVIGNPLRSDAPPPFHSPSNSGSPAISASIQ